VSNTAEGITEIGDDVFRDSLTEAQAIPEDTGDVMKTGEIVLSGPAAESNTRVVEANLGESFD
jgi:hypothetical protein